jgi:hypothetical protein
MMDTAYWDDEAYVDRMRDEQALIGDFGTPKELAALKRLEVALDAVAYALLWMKLVSITRPRRSAARQAEFNAEWLAPHFKR